MTIALLTEPWEWTLNQAKNPESYLLDSNSSFYLDYKVRIEKAIDGAFYRSDLKNNYLRAQVVKFYKYGNIKKGYFENEKATTTTTTIKPICDLSSLLGKNL